MFDGFDREFPRFLADLSTNNTQQWFAENSARYDRLCRGPISRLIDGLAFRLEIYDPPHLVETDQGGSIAVKKRIRAEEEHLSGDFNPFVHLHFQASCPSQIAPKLHLVFGSCGLGLGGGFSSFSPQQAQRFQRALSKPEHLTALDRAVEAAQKSGCYLENLRETKSVPALSKSEGEEQLAPYKKQQGILVRSRNEGYSPAIFTEDCVDYIDFRLRQLLPLQQWLVQHIVQDDELKFQP
ncbi:MAG: DUF2461 family protein [Salaquimonas sp.]